MLKQQGVALIVVGLGIGVGVSLAAQPAGDQHKEGNGGPRHRLLWDRGEFQGTVTADGQWLSYPDWHGVTLGVRNLVTGKNRLVIDRGGYFKGMGKTERTTVSPDGRFFAFTWEHRDPEIAKKGVKYQVRMVGADGRGERNVLGEKGMFSQPQSWSPDSKWLAATTNDATSGKIMLLSSEGAPSRLVATLDRVPARVMFSPDGKWLAFHAPTPGAPARPATTRSDSVYILPVDGSVSVPTQVVSDAHMTAWTPDGAAIVFRRERNTLMELYLQPVAHGRAAGDARKVHGATDIGSPVAMTSQGTLIYGTVKRASNAAFAAIDPATGAIGPPAVTIPVIAGALGVVVRYSPDGRHVLFPTSPGTIVIRSLDEGTERTLTTHMKRVEALDWAADSGSLLISGLPAAGKEGLYRVDLQSGAGTLLFEQPGLWPMTPSPDGQSLYYVKYQTEPDVVLMRDLKTGVERTVAKHDEDLNELKVSRDGRTLALVGYEFLSLLNLGTGVSKLLYTHPPDVYEKFWAGEFSADGRHFLTATSLSLNPQGPRELWSLPVDGGPPLRQPLPWHVTGLALSRDGTQLAMVRAETVQQVWALENFLPTSSSRR